MEKDQLLTFFRKRIEPFIALGILILLLILVVQLMNGNELREEISKTCGWVDEDYRCFCEKSKAIEIMNKINNSFNVGDVEYVQVSR